MPKPHSAVSYKGQYKDLFDKIRLYWGIYGGWSAFVRSPYFHLSVLVLALTTNHWINGEWWTNVIDIVPSMLGFTLAGFAIFLGFGDSEFLAIISGNEEGQAVDASPYLDFSSRFMHFVMVQIAALFAALIAQALDFPPPDCLAAAMEWPKLIGNMVGYWLFLYGLCTGLASGVAIFALAKNYDDYSTATKRSDVNNNS